MRLLLALAFLGLLSLTTQAQAASSSYFRFEGGSVLIHAGSPAHQLVRYLGEPLDKAYETVCLSRNASGRCNRWSEEETWFYRYDFRDWTIKVRRGIITHIEWRRY